MIGSVAGAIYRSVSHGEIVTLEWSADRERDLLAACADSVRASSEIEEYWGDDVDGHEWRVHLRRRAWRSL